MTIKIDEVFPKDPTEPSIKWAGAIQAHMVVPWAQGRIQLGAGFNTQRAQNDSLFVERRAFREIRNTPLQYRECQSTTIKDDSGTNIGTATENITFAISASVGGSFLGASGRGSYEKSVRDNKNTSNITVSAEHTCGQIDYVITPQLDIDAVSILMDAEHPIDEFRESFGDFYVAGYRVGAVNNTTISGQLVNKSYFEAKRAELKVKAVFVTINKSINEVSQSASNSGGIKVSAFDSLSAFYSDFAAISEEDSIRVGNVAFENKQRAMNIAKRAADVLSGEFSMGRESTVYQDTVDRLCDRGLVTDLLLAPFASLREFQSILSYRFNVD